MRFRIAHILEAVVVVAVFALGFSHPNELWAGGMRRILIIIAAVGVLGVALLALYGREDSLEFEIYEIGSNSAPKLLAKGTVPSDGSNVKTAERTVFGRRFQNKWIPLDEGFLIGASIYRPKKLEGFGLWIRSDDVAGHSWNWFTRESGRVYRKLQGSGRVEASVIQHKDYEVLEAVRFLDDVTLTAQFGWLPYWDTHQVVVKKGSVLRLPQSTER
jgi:hypothetical protein